MTPFGKALRHLRIEREMLLGTMADAFGYSAAYCSQIERGKRAIPAGYVDKVRGLFRLDVSQANKLREAAIESTEQFQINLPKNARPADRLLANELATEFARMSPEAKQKIRKIVRGDG